MSGIGLIISFVIAIIVMIVAMVLYSYARSLMEVP